jgi:hypothetical protein
MCVLTGLVVYIIIGINVTIEWIGEWQQQGHLSKLQIKESKANGQFPAMSFEKP